MKKQKLLIFGALLIVLAGLSSPLKAAEDPFRDVISVNFYMHPWPWTTDAQKETITLEPGQSAGYDGWLTDSWINYNVPWGPSEPQDPFTITNSKGSEATLNFITCRNGGAFIWGDARTYLLGNANADLMDGHINSTVDNDKYFEMTVTDIPYDTYDVIIYLGGNEAQFNNGKIKISFNGGPEQDLTLSRLNVDESTFTFTEIVDATTPGNYIVYKGVTGSSFSVWTQGDGFNHLGPSGFQFGILDIMNPYPADGDDQVIASNPLTLSWTNLDPVDANIPTTVDVYFSTDPCDLGEPIVIDQAISSVDVDASALGTYYWKVDSNTGDPNIIPGKKVYSFTTVEDPAPVITSITPDQMGWSGGTVPLTVDVTNLGPAETVYAWSADADPTLDIIIVDGETATPTVMITKVPYYEAQIENAGFEYPAFADGESDWIAPAGWTGEAIGIWNPGEEGTSWPGFGGVAPEGENVLFVNANGYASTTTSETIQEGATYTLSVYVGLNQAYGSGATYNIQLLAGTGEDAAVLAEDDNSMNIALGTFENAVLTYTNDPVADANKVGLPLQVRFACTSGGNTDVEFDNVVLTSDTAFPGKTGVQTVTMTVAVSDAANPEPVTATMDIDVYEDACEMARLGLGLDDPYDINKDCIIDVDDLAIMAAAWLDDISLTGATASSEQSIPYAVFNGEFNVYKQGTGYTVTADSMSGSNYITGVGDDPAAINTHGGTYNFSDGTTGKSGVVPGWEVTSSHVPNLLMNGIDGTWCLHSFGAWSGSDGSRVRTTVPIGYISAGRTYDLSAMVFGNPGTRILRLLADGVEVTPASKVDPPDGTEWNVISRVYDPNVLSAHIGKSIAVELGIDEPVNSHGGSTRFDNVTLESTIVNTNVPSVEAGDDLVTWSGEPLTLNPTVVNNDPNDPQGELTYLWTADPEDGVVFSPAGSEDPNSSAEMAPTVTITKPEGGPVDVVLKLAVTIDGKSTVCDHIIVTVYDDACKAHVGDNPELGYDSTDFTEDCITNLADFAQLAAEWFFDYKPIGPIDKIEE